MILPDEWFHEPPDYRCPFCAFVAGTGEVPTASDLVAETELALAFVSPRWWPKNRGHVIVIPRAHHENVYSTPDADAAAVAALVRRAAIAIRATDGCDGVSTRQHTEPAGNQDVWHSHTHVFPRWEGDGLYATRSMPGWADVAERAARARALAAHPIWAERSDEPR